MEEGSDAMREVWPHDFLLIHLFAGLWTIKEEIHLTCTRTVRIHFSLPTTVNLQNTSFLKYSGTLNYCSKNYIVFGHYDSFQVICLIFFNQPANVFPIPCYVLW
jgi:hypothetical protein